jgi:glycosyltransferase involved in cell wall biosynthesis
MRDVGIVMPVYKQDPVYLELALRSILVQSYQNYYFIIVSDGAPSETVNVIKNVTEGDERVQLILKEENEGVAKTLNMGFDHLMKMEDVKYLTWVSSDNIYYSFFIEKLRSALEKAPDQVGLSYSSFRHIDQDGNYLIEPALEQFYKYQNQPKENLLDSCFIGVSFMYKKEVAEKIDGYRLEPVEDYDYWLRITEKCDIVYVKDSLMEYRKNSPLSLSAQLNSSKNEHRRWRYAFTLARQQARNRRNIPFLLTVIYPVNNGSVQTIEKLEALLEQTFSNYKIIIIDRSMDQSATNLLKHIEDPRVKFIALPGASESKSISYGMGDANTPYTLIYGRGTFPSSPFVLNNLIQFYNHLLQQGYEKNNTAVFDNNNGNVAFRLVSEGKVPIFGAIYNTGKLISLLKDRGN